MDEPTATPRHTPVEGHGECIKALEAVLERGRQVLRIFDPNLAGQDYNSVRRYELLRSFLLSSRNNRLYIVVHDTSHIVRECPRLQMLLRQFSHAVAVHETETHIKSVAAPLAIADDDHYFHRFHQDAWRGLLALDDPSGARDMLQRFGEIWEASFPAVSATTLGL